MLGVDPTLFFAFRLSSNMSFREWLSKRTSDFIWTCFLLFIVACVVWINGSVFFSIAAFLLIGILAVAPLLCVMIPIFLLYLLLRGVVDAIRRGAIRRS